MTEDFWITVLMIPSAIAHWTIDTLFPRYCVGCGASDWAICHNCRELVIEVKQQQCIKCRAISKMGVTCPKCRPTVPIKQTVVALQFGDGPVREALHWLKYHGRRDVMDTLMPYLISNADVDKTLSSLPNRNVIITPVPLSRRRQWWRGFNQSTLISQALVRQYQLPMLDVLKRQSFYHTQAGLHRRERAQNVRQAFGLKNPDSIKGKTIVLVDDIVTTGATLIACADVLKKSGAKTIIAVVLAQAQ